MIWIKLILGGLWSRIVALLKWAAGHPWQAACIVLAAVALWQTRAASEWREATNVAQTALKAQQAAIIAGQKQAEAMEAARLARVTKQQEGISHDVSQDYARRLADLRARHDRLRKSAQGSERAAEGVALSGVSAPADRTDEAPAGEGLPLDKQLIASEQAEQLDALITWIERQAAVDPNEGAQ